MNGDQPVVTIIVLDPGDTADRDERLARSIASVRGQSLRGVELVVTDDRLPPNTALEQAGGDYVLFLNAGDVLDRHAARTAVAAAQDFAADVVSGGWQPGTMTTGTAEPDPVLRRLFRRTSHYRDLYERPELFYDTTISNKLFSRSFLHRNGLRFLGDGAAASLGFVTSAYLQAHAITVVPQRMFTQSASPARSDPEQLLVVHRELDRLIAQRTDPAITVAKDVRFLEIDLPHYVLGAAAQPADRATSLLDQLAGYLDSLRPESLAAVGRMVQVAVFLVGRSDLLGAESAVRYLVHGRELTGGLVQRQGRVYWTDRHLDTAEGRDAQDVTALGFHELPVSQLRPQARILDLQVNGRTATWRGTVANPLGRIDPSRSRIALSVGPRGSDRRELIPIDVVADSDRQLSWQAAFALPAVVRPTCHGYRSWTVELSISQDGETTLVPLSPDPTLTAAHSLLTRRRWYPVGGTLLADTNDDGSLVLRLAPRGRVAELAARQGRRVVPDPAERVEPPRRGPRGAVLTGSLRTKARVLRFLLVRLPQHRRLVVFESHMGMSYSDNPKYVSEELQRRTAGFDIVWSFAGEPPAVPAGVRTVRRVSWRHFLALARARYWVDNQGLPQAIQKPDRVVYLQTWHGSALKRMGEDTPAFRRMQPQQQERHRRGVQRWDYFVARSEHDVRTLVPALSVRGEILRTGYPRNDPLVQLRSQQERMAVRAQLGLPAEQTLVLYAPTFRETYASGLQDFELPIDLDAMFAKLPDHRLLVRTHYLQRLQLPAATHTVVRDVSHLPDITPLMVAADLLVTDYSSVMFDFANTGRPMVFFVYDYDDYANSERGVYFELSEKAPGPLVHTGEELIQALATVDSWQPDYAQRYQRFVAEFGEYDTGSAARQVVDRVFFGSAGDD